LLLSYFFAHHLYPQYSLSSFVKGLQIYDKLYVERGAGVPFGSSLYGLWYVSYHVLGHFGIYPPIPIKWVFLVSAAAIFGLVVWMMIRKTTNMHFIPFAICSLYILINPIAADYHLMVFVLPLILIHLQFDEWKNDRVALAVVALSAILLLVPKDYVHVGGFSLQVMINPAILLFATCFLFVLNFETQPSLSRTQFE